MAAFTLRQENTWLTKCRASKCMEEQDPTWSLPTNLAAPLLETRKNCVTGFVLEKKYPRRVPGKSECLYKGLRYFQGWREQVAYMQGELVKNLTVRHKKSCMRGGFCKRVLDKGRELVSG